ncbi:MAG TPA: lactate utilization protein B [Anaeromyxobacteraceae bacterium]|nr:lactate utilization protein B [Anaeromyxobacteraceae bacterium]
MSAAPPTEVEQAGRAGHAERAAAFVANGPRAHWHDEALWWVRAKRDRAAGTIPEWEALRDLAARIRAHVRSNLADYLEQFERNAIARGAQVHWARDAAEHDAIVHRILSSHGVRLVAKSKSMLTEECGLNPYLEARGVEVVDTDLGERIVQLARQPPSHIVFPAIHFKKEEIGDLFHEKIGTPRGLSDPTALTEAARQHLRRKFMTADAGITGVNFAIAETGGVVVCTNEGNADLGASLPRLHVACMGIEKIVPRLEDLAVFLRLLARSATGQPITVFTSHFHGPIDGGELHVVIVDNGRSRLLADPSHRSALSCIRCGACMNTCPVYRRSGGHSYSAVTPGPIGILLTAARSPSANPSLPLASSLCGSCDDVCPVKIDLHSQILELRQRLARAGVAPLGKRLAMQLASRVLRSRALYEAAGRMLRAMLRSAPRGLVENRWNAWSRQRALPPAPAESFRDAYRRRLDGRGARRVDGRGPRG